jgi:hypothetical protein
MSYGADIGRATAMQAAFIGGKVAGREELIEELEQPCTEHLKYSEKLRITKRECSICYKKIRDGE